MLYTAALTALGIGWSGPFETQILGTASGAALYCCALILTLSSPKIGASLSSMSLAAWTLAYASVAVGLASLTYLGPQKGFQVYLPLEQAPSAIRVMLVGLTMLVLGYVVANHLGDSSKASRPERRPHWLLTSSPLRIVVAYAVGIGATGASFIVTGSFSYVGDSEESAMDASGLTQPLAVVVFLRTAALICAAFLAFRHPSAGHRTLVIALLGGELALASISGMKENFVLPCVAVLLAYAFTRGRLPWAALLAGLVLFVFVVAPFVAGVRAIARDNGSTRGAAEVVQMIVDEGYFGVRNRVDESSLESDSDLRTVASRLRLSDNVIVIRQRTPSVIPYRPASELTTAVFSSVVPRALWPDKPLRLSGLEFNRDYYNSRSYSAAAVTFQGSLWMYGGWVPLLLGCAVLGAVLRGVDVWSRRRAFGAGSLLLMLLFSNVVKQELDSATLLANTPIMLVTLLFAMLVLRQGPSERREVPTVTRPGRRQDRQVIRGLR